MKVNKKGFTLIELIVTIMLLAIIVLIALPSINGILDKNEKNNCNSLKRSIVEAAKLYASDNRYEIVWTKQIEECNLDEYNANIYNNEYKYYNYYIEKNPRTRIYECYREYNTLDSLDKLNNYLKKDIVNPCDSGKEINPSSDIKVTLFRYKDKTIEYDVQLSEGVFNCCK